jgi:hypothetical protein
MSTESRISNLDHTRVGTTRIPTSEESKLSLPRTMTRCCTLDDSRTISGIIPIPTRQSPIIVRSSVQHNLDISRIVGIGLVSSKNGPRPTVARAAAICRPAIRKAGGPCRRAAEKCPSRHEKRAKWEKARARARGISKLLRHIPLPLL